MTAKPPLSLFRGRTEAEIADVDSARTAATDIMSFIMAEIESGSEKPEDKQDKAARVRPWGDQALQVGSEAECYSPNFAGSGRRHLTLATDGEM